MEVYRGGRVNPNNPYTWVTEDEEFASNYGKVEKYFIPDTVNIIDANTESFYDLMEEFYDTRDEGYADDIKFNPEVEWTKFLKSKGYDGFVNDDNILLVDKNILQKISMKKQSMPHVETQNGGAIDLEIEKLPEEQRALFLNNFISGKVSKDGIYFDDLDPSEQGRIQEFHSKLTNKEYNNRVNTVSRLRTKLSIKEIQAILTGEFKFGDYVEFYPDTVSDNKEYTEHGTVKNDLGDHIIIEADSGHIYEVDREDIIDKIE